MVVCTHPCANLWPAEVAKHVLGINVKNVIEEKTSLQLMTSKVGQQQYSNA